MNSTVVTAIFPVDDKQKLLICGMPQSITSHVLELCRQVIVQEFGACDVVNINVVPVDTQDQIQSAAGPLPVFYGEKMVQNNCDTQISSKIK